MSSALPCGTPSTMSKRTMSPSSLSPASKRDGAADLPGADQRDLVACHGNASFFCGAECEARDGPRLTANPEAEQGSGRRRG